MSNYILQNEPVSLRQIHEHCIPSRKYHRTTIYNRVLEMPTVLVEMGRSEKQSVLRQGETQLFVIQKNPNIDYQNFFELGIKLGIVSKSSQAISFIPNEQLKLLHRLASSEKDCQLLTFAATSNLSAKQTRQAYGRDCGSLKLKVEENLERMQSIYAAYDELLYIQDSACVQSLGICGE
jgi:hypothetical protein